MDVADKDNLANDLVKRAWRIPGERFHGRHPRESGIQQSPRAL